MTTTTTNKNTTAADTVNHSTTSPSPIFASLHLQRAILRRTAEEAAAAVMADASDEDPLEQAAQTALTALWSADDHMMATPTQRPADLGVKAAFLAGQLEEFGHLERRYAEAIVADLCRLFPQPGPPPKPAAEAGKRHEGRLNTMCRKSMAKAITAPDDAPRSRLLLTIEKMAAMAERLENADTNAAASRDNANDVASGRKINRLYAQWLAIRACK